MSSERRRNPAGAHRVFVSRTRRRTFILLANILPDVAHAHLDTLLYEPLQLDVPYSLNRRCRWLLSEVLPLQSDQQSKCSYLSEVEPSAVLLRWNPKHSWLHPLQPVLAKHDFGSSITTVKRPPTRGARCVRCRERCILPVDLETPCSSQPPIYSPPQRRVIEFKLNDIKADFQQFRKHQRSPQSNTSKKRKGNKSKGYIRQWNQLTATCDRFEVDACSQLISTMKRKHLSKASHSVDTGVLEQRRMSIADELERWLIRGDVARLECLILQGKSELLKGKTSPHVKTRAFLKSMNGYAQAVDAFLSAVVAGNVHSVKEMGSYKHSSSATHPATRANALHLAAIWGQMDVLRLLVRTLGVHVNDRDMEGRTPLHYAAAFAGGDESKIAFYDLLVTHGANEEAVDTEGYSPPNYLRNPGLLDFRQVQGLNKYPLSTGDEVDQLITRRNIRALEDILLSGDHALLENRIFPPGTQDLEGILVNLKIRVSAIHEAIRDGDEATFKHLVDKKRLACARDQDGRTPLHSAVLHDREEIANYLLLVYPHCVDQTDKKGRTAFHYTCCLPDINKQQTFSRLLLGAGTNRTIKDTNGHSAGYYQKHPRSGRRLYEAVRYQPPTESIMTDEVTSPTNINEDVERQVLDLVETEDYRRLETLMHEGKGDEINKIARKHTKNKAVFKLITGFRSVQSRLKAAMEAVDDADMAKVKLSVDKRQVAEARDMRGFGILHMAVFRERHEIVELLAKTLPVCMTVVDHHGRSALHYAATQQNAIYDTLVDAGADANLPDNDGVTPEEYRRTPDKMPRPSSAVTEISSVIIADLPHAAIQMLEDPIYDPDAPAQDLIDEWLADGETDHLEQLVLDGRGQLLIDRKSSNPASAEFLRALIQYQAKIDAIHKAVEEGDVRRVKSLIDRAQLATARDRQGLTPLHKAVLHGQTNTVRYLLARYPNIVNATDHVGRTPLHYATADPNGEHFIKMLQKAGGDAFIEDKHEHTPFYYRTHPRGMNLRTLKDNAVMNQLMTGELSRPLLQDLEEDITDWLHTGNIGKLEELVLNGYADLLLGRTHEVEDLNAVSFLEILPQYQAKIQAIHKAVQSGNLRSVKLLTDRKKLALCRDARGLSPLHNAIVFDKPDIAKYLVRNYPQSVNAMDHNKRTPLHYAAALRDGGYLYKIMRKAGADPNILDCNARPAKYYLRYPGELDLMTLKMDTKTALKHVLHNRVAPSYLESNIQQWLREGNVNKLEQLVLSGCGDLLLERKSGNPDAAEFLNDLEEYLQKIDNIHKAVREGDMRQFKQLVDRRRLAMARDRKGCTPLHDAIVYEQTDVVRYIASNYSTVLNAPDYNKRTPMHYAAAARDGGHYLKILSKAGADPMAVDNEGRTPDYYRRNPGIIDLKLIRERDQDIADVLVLNEHMFEEAADFERVDSRLSDADSVLTAFSSQRDEDIDDAARAAFEVVLNERVEAHLRMTDRRTLPATENGLYLARTVGPILTKALAEVVIRRPSDPITFISDWLYRYHEENAVRWENAVTRTSPNHLEVNKTRPHRAKRTNRLANGDGH